MQFDNWTQVEETFLKYKEQGRDAEVLTHLEGLFRSVATRLKTGNLTVKQGQRKKSFNLKNSTVPVEELVQEGFLAALECLPRWNPKKGKFTTFLYSTIVPKMFRYGVENTGVLRIPNSTQHKHKVSDQGFRTEKGEKMARMIYGEVFAHHLPGENSNYLSFEETYDSGNRVTGSGYDLEKVLSTLDEEDRIVVSQALLGDKSYAEIGQELGVSKQAIGLRINRIKAKIKDIHGDLYQ